MAQSNDPDSPIVETEFRRYIKIIQPYLSQITDQNIVDVCNAWLQRLSQCTDEEKGLRNKYIFTMCYQLTRGTIGEPFLRCPPQDLLEAFSDNDSSIEDSGSEYLAVDVDTEKRLGLGFNKMRSHSNLEKFCKDGEISDDISEKDIFCLTLNTEALQTNEEMKRHTTQLSLPSNPRCNRFNSDEEDFRPSSLVNKLREIRNQNVLLHDELKALKEESTNKSYSQERITRVIDCKSSSFQNDDSMSTVMVMSLKNRLKDIQESRNDLIESIKNLNNRLETVEYKKCQEIEEIKSKHKLELVMLKLSVKEKIENKFDKIIEDLKKAHDTKVTEIRDQSAKEISLITTTTNKIIDEKDKEINQLQSQMADLRTDLQAKKSLDNTDTESYKNKVHQLEKKIVRLEKSKTKFIHTYESRVAHMQREKQLTDCSLHLQLARLRAQVVNDIANESETELHNSITKLETKYKDIVANIQATAIQRRIQDQAALDSIMKAACGVTQADGAFLANQRSNNIRFPPKTIRTSDTEGNQGFNTEISSVRHNAQVVNAVGNAASRSLEEETDRPRFCLNSERLGELFERVYIPQRDTGDGIHK